MLILFYKLMPFPFINLLVLFLSLWLIDYAGMSLSWMLLCAPWSVLLCFGLGLLFVVPLTQ